MKSKDISLKIAGSIFGIVALLHLVRLITGASVTIGGWEMPMLMSMAGLIGGAVLSIWFWLQSVNRDR
jgi:uncharacterized membrane protein